MKGRNRLSGRHSIKKQWYVLYFAVLIIPLLVMVYAYRLSYTQLSEAVYDRQMAHLTLVRELVDAEARNMSATMLSFGTDRQTREAISVQSPSEENQMSLFRSLISIVGNASANNDLVDHYALYFTESDYLLDDGHWNPRRVISWKGYDGAISETELTEILENAQPSHLDLTIGRSGSVILYTKVNVYRAREPLYVAAVLSSAELSRLLGSGTAGKEALIAIESLEGSLYFCNDTSLDTAFREHPGDWFHAEVDSEVMPLRYLYASPAYIVEEKLTSYRYMLLALLAVSLVFGGIAIIIAVHRQYAPIARLMQHFSDGEKDLQNEYSNISDYLLQAQERNDHHFMTDLLLGNVKDHASFPWQQVVLISPLDAQSLLHLEPDLARKVFPGVRVISVYEHTVLIFQQQTHSETQLMNDLKTLMPEWPVYIICTQNEGQSLHRAYSDLGDMLASLRFFQTEPSQVFHVSPDDREQTLVIMGGTFEEDIRTAVFSHNQEKAWMLMQGALDNMRDKCHSGTLLRGSLYAVSLLFMRLEASVRAQNASVPDGVAGDAVKAYRFATFDQLEAGTRQALHDMINALEMPEGKKAFTLFDQIDTFIRQNFQNPDLNVEMIADHLNFSAVYLRRVYKQGSGSSISDAILKLRIENAKQMLTAPSSRVNDVAQQVGFLEAGTFIRSFKKLEGMTPGAYKNQYQSIQMQAREEEKE